MFRTSRIAAECSHAQKQLNKITLSGKAVIRDA